MNSTIRQKHETKKYVVHGTEMLEKKVNKYRDFGRIYLPVKWIGKKVKIIRID